MFTDLIRARPFFRIIRGLSPCLMTRALRFGPRRPAGA